MRLRLIRSATLILEIAGKRILVDPMLAEAESIGPRPNFPDDRRWPLVPLPVPASEVTKDLDAILATHVHIDHFDDAAVSLLPKNVPVVCQPWDADALREFGFVEVHPVEEAVEFLGIEFARTEGKHGVGVVGLRMGRTSGFVLRAPGEPTVYIAGDTIWCGHVREALETFEPDVVVVNAGAAQFRMGSRIIMNEVDVTRVCQTAPDAVVVAVHLDTVPHCRLTRADLRERLHQRGLLSRVRIPADGEVLEFAAP